MDQEQQIPKMKPSDDEIAQRQQQLRRQAQQRLAQAGGAQKVTAAHPAPEKVSAQYRPAAPARSSGSAMTAIALVAGLAGLGGAAYLFTELQKSSQALVQAQAQLADQSAQLATLNERLSVSGENANLSVDALKVVLREQDQEIRKLWDVANKKNRTDIDNNSAQIAKLSSGISAMGNTGKELTALRTGLTAAEEADAGLRRQISELQASLNSLPAQTELAIAQNKESIDLLDGSVASLRQSVEKLRTSSTSANLTDMKLEIEDIQIRLDRIQNAMTGSAP